jgi:hypothetical protein
LSIGWGRKMTWRSFTTRNILFALFIYLELQFCTTNRVATLNISKFGGIEGVGGRGRGGVGGKGGGGGRGEK